MAIPIVVGDVIEARLYVGMVDQIGVNVFYYVVQAITGVPVLDDVPDALDTNFRADYRACMTSEATYYGLVASRIAPGPRTLAKVSTAAFQVGLAATPAAPKAVSNVITKITDLAGQGNRGRIYVAFPPQEWGDTFGNYGGAGDAALASLADAVKVGINSGGGGNTATLKPIIWHKASHTWTLLTNAIPRGYWATQRRRGQTGRVNPLPPIA